VLEAGVGADLVVQLAQRNDEDARDLVGVGLELRHGIEPSDDRSHDVAADVGRERIELAEDLDRVGIERDLLVRLAQRRGSGARVAGVDRSPRERDLTFVARKGLGSKREDKRGLGPPHHRDQHGRRARPLNGYALRLVRAQSRGQLASEVFGHRSHRSLGLSHLIHR
jgi:hypothetical protein